MNERFVNRGALDSAVMAGTTDALDEFIQNNAGPLVAEATEHRRRLVESLAEQKKHEEHEQPAPVGLEYEQGRGRVEPGKTASDGE